MGLFFTLHSGSNIKSAQGTYQAIFSYDIQLALGESMTGHYNLFGNNKNWCFISFSSHPSKDYGSGSVQGYQVFVGT
jgi:hypothetical protein